MLLGWTISLPCASLPTCSPCCLLPLAALPSPSPAGAAGAPRRPLRRAGPQPGGAGGPGGAAEGADGAEQCSACRCTLNAGEQLMENTDWRSRAQGRRANVLVSLTHMA